MMKRSDQYWKRRADQRMQEYIYRAERDADIITASYLKASDYLSNEAQKILKTFARDKGISEAEARRVLNRYGTEKSLQKLVAGISDPEQRRRLQTYIDAPAYAARIRRLEDLREDVERQCRELYHITAEGTTRILRNTVKKAYPRVMFDIQKGVGYGFSFSMMPASRVDELLRQNWSGTHYSRRIWDNVDKLADTVKEDLLVGFMTGRGTEKTAKAIQERMSCGSMEARRIVRTETNYIANQAELQSYRDCGIERYRFLATLDSRTSEQCQRLDNKVFAVSMGQAGVNLPPMHPNCRSTTIAVFDDEAEEGMMRRARNPITGESELASADMNYAQWKKKYMQVEKSEESGILEERKIRQYSITDQTIQNIPIVESFFVTAERLQEEHKQLLRYVKDEPVGTEAVAYYDSDMNLLDRYMGENSSVKAKQFDTSHIVMHNHPSGETFTHADIEHFAENPDIIVLTAVGNDGRVYLLEKLDRYDAASFIFAYENSNIWEIENVTAVQYLERIDQFLKGAEKYGVRYIAGR